jgi:hypothetical protein
MNRCATRWRLSVHSNVGRREVAIVKQQRHSAPRIREALSDEDQWYLLIGDRQHGPIRLEHLAAFARQGQLLETNWVWRVGLVSWIAAGDVPGLFADSAGLRHEPAPPCRSAEQGEAPASKPGFKAKAKHQIKSFAIIFLYLWIVFGMLAIHESIVLAQHQIAYVSHGLAVVNALIFGKVMLVAEDLRLGRRLEDEPLAYSILFKSLLFGITLICFHILEHVLIGMWHGNSAAQSIAAVGANNLPGIISIGAVTTVALVPFFILREIGRVIGEEKLWALFFQRKSS